jgi:SpoIID/LytB domain protein
VLALAAIVTVAGPAHASGPGSSEGGALGSSPPHDAIKARGFTFYGSGWGHGIGMSQWGAYGLARGGSAYTRILTRFYSGTKVVTPAYPVRNIRIGLTYDRTLIHLTARVAPVRFWVKRPQGTFVGKIPIGATWAIRPTKRGYAIRDGSGKLVGGHTWGGSAYHVYATFANNGAHVFVPEADAIWGRGFTYARGHLEFNLYGCASNTCRERLILSIAFEKYLLGIGEMPSSWPIEALKTQAVAARTYATYTVKRYGLRTYCNCDLTDGSEDQVYVGWSKESGPDGERWVHAVRGSVGRVVTHGGATIQAFYAASDGGHTENVEDVWHGGDPAYAIPYLRGVCDPGESTAANPWTNWQRHFTASEVTNRLAPYTGSIGTVSSFPAVDRGVGGGIIRVTVKGSGGKAVVSGSELRAGLALPEIRVWINRNKNVLGTIRTKYDALNCAPGLPTTPVGSVPGGSRQKFRQGGIFRNDDPGITVWLKGQIYGEYLRVGGATGRLKLPISKIAAVRVDGRATAGKRALFEAGRIYWKDGVGGHALWGKVLKVYLRRGGATGSLGYPTTRVQVAPDGTTSARFEHGRILCPAGKACRVTIG